MSFEFDYGAPTWPFKMKKVGFLMWHWTLSKYENDYTEWAGISATRIGALRAMRKIKREQLSKPKTEKGYL